MHSRRRILAAIAPLLFSLASSAAEREPIWISDANGCKFLAPNDKPPPQQLRWEGACVDGYLSGPGKADFGRFYYQGEFERGAMAQGEVTFTKGGGYKGQLKNNQPHGHGTLTRPEGMILTGEFVNAEPAGILELTFPWGDRYRGTVDPKTFLMEGHGRLSEANGSYYEGDFKHGAFHGKGKFVWSQGGSYTGDYAFGKYEGKGVLEYLDGSRYEGGFAAGSRQGQGTHVYANGGRYAGEFLADMRHGKGMMQFASGAVEEGEWKADKLHGQCKILYANKSFASGQCVSGALNGEGRFEDPTAELQYEGGFVDNRYHGRGRLKEPGYAYEGDFVAGARAGRGKEVLESGEQYQGEFANDRRNGRGTVRGTAPSGAAILYDGDFKNGLAQGTGTLKVGDESFAGEFDRGVFIRGVLRTKTGRAIEMDVEAGTYLDVQPDGTKIPIDPEDLARPQA